MTERDNTATYPESGIASDGPEVVMVRSLTRNRFVSFIRQEPLGAAAAVFIIIFIFIAITAPWISPYDPIEQDRQNILMSPSASHLLGTDDLGRDILSRTIYGARTSLVIAVVSIAIGGVIGTMIGAISGYWGGSWPDNIVQRIMDAFMAIPAIVLLLFVASLLGPSIRNTIIALVILIIPQLNRVARGEMLRVRTEGYIEASRSIGCSTPRILVRHGIPNLMAPMMVMGSLTFAIILIAEASISFLGIGTPPPTPSWGRMLSEGSARMEIAPWVAVFPGLALSLAVLGFNLLGDALRNYLDPKQRSR